MGISDHLTCLLRNLYSGQQLEPDMEKQTGWVQSLGQEDPLGKEMATHSSTLAWKISKD